MPSGGLVYRPQVAVGGYTQITIAREAPGAGRVRFSDRTIFGLLAVAVFSPVNADQRVPDGYHFTFARQPVRMVEQMRQITYAAAATTRKARRDRERRPSAPRRPDPVPALPSAGANSHD
jgi:hypothetical protein